MVFIFAGTTEGRALTGCAAEHEIEARVYVATEEGRRAILRGDAEETEDAGRESADAEERELLPAEDGKLAICVGRKNYNNIKSELDRYRPTIIFDATHPYAKEITENCRRAAAAAKIRYVRVLRETSALRGDITAADVTEAARILHEKFAGKRVLLTTGSKELAAFTGTKKGGPALKKDPTSDPVFFARILPGEENEAHAVAAGIPGPRLITGYGPFTEAENRAHLEAHRIDVLVTKESGAAGGYGEKLHAAAALGVKTIVIRRPEEPDGVSLREAETLLIKSKEELI